MRFLIASILLAAVTGCVTHNEEKPYVYTPTITVTLSYLYHTNNCSVAVLEMKNVSEYPIWFEGEDNGQPACCLEYKSSPVAEHSPGMLWGDIPLTMYRLDSGQSNKFVLSRKEFTEPFRVGVWISESRTQEDLQNLIYWSPFINP